MYRCSSLDALMTNAKGSAEFSATAITSMMSAVREEVFGVRKNLDDVSAIQKGRMCEDLGVELYNEVFLYNLIKVPPEGRRDNGIITGEPDLVASSSNKGVDIKVAWSLLTFPMTPKEVIKKGYEWQARGYMCLFDLPVWEIAYCAIDTPEELLKPWHDRSEHIIDSAIPAHHRITIARYERDEEKEKLMLDKAESANAWIEQAVKDFAKEHDKYIN